MYSIVVTEIKASILRHRLFDRLAGRTDIVTPHDLSPVLARRIPRFLVAGLDDGRDPGTGGWPVHTGGRCAKLCFSPVLDTAGSDDGHNDAHRLPLNELAYLEYVEKITGIGTHDADDFARIYRFEPAELFNACRSLREDCPPAWRLLLSNEFALAKRLWRDLGIEPPGSQFRHPLIDAFRMIAEIERASLMMRHLARARAILDRPRFLEALTSPLPLSAWFKPDQLIEVYRWMEYATFSSAALTDLVLNRSVEGVRSLPRGYGPWSIVRGEMIGAAKDFHDHPEMRKVVSHVFALPPLVEPGATDDPNIKPSVERRRDILRNDEILRWYGMTGEVLPIIALDDARATFPTRRARNSVSMRRATVADNSRLVLGRLASAVRNHADPAMQRKVDGAPAKYLEDFRSTQGHEPTLEANVKLGLKMALLYLPSQGRLGSGARFDPLAWATPLRDAELWRMLLDLKRGSRLRSLVHLARNQLRTVTWLMNRVYGSHFNRLEWSPEVERVICDMACSLSPISVDPHIAFAIRRLGGKPNLHLSLGGKRRRTGFGKKGVG